MSYTLRKDQLLSQIIHCRICENELPHCVNPIVSFSKKSKIVIIGQAPGKIAHRNKIPWDDMSGIRLRNWLGVDESLFYNNELFALIPMSFCFPGSNKKGDLPPRIECAPKWHDLIFEQFENPPLIILIGNYAQKYYLRERKKSNLTQTVKSYKEYLPDYFVLPHPSPRNNIWIKKNIWFENNVLSDLKQIIKNVI